MFQNRVRSQQLLAVISLGFLGLIVSGCSGSTSASQRLDKAFKAGNLQKSPVAKFAGTVRVDGQPPGQFTLVMLVDPKRPSPDRLLKAICDPEGNFAFTTYESGDGVPVGSYVVLFGQFNIGGRLGLYEPPDLLHNLYNDPDQNSQIPEFRVEVADPGKTDYAFSLTVVGKDPAKAAGPHAITEIR